VEWVKTSVPGPSSVGATASAIRSLTAEGTGAAEAGGKGSRIRIRTFGTVTHDVRQCLAESATRGETGVECELGRSQ
jgi:hypothetical protein